MPDQTIDLAPLRVVAIVASLLTTSCASEPAQLVVVVSERGYHPGSDLTHIEISVSSPTDSAPSEVVPVVVTDDAEAGGGALSMPFSFAVAPRDGDVDRRVRLDVAGYGNATCVAGATAIESCLLVRQTVSTGFVEGKVLLLPIVLSRSCEGLACDGARTCSFGECVLSDSSPELLDEVPPGEELAALDDSLAVFTMRFDLPPATPERPYVVAWMRDADRNPFVDEWRGGEVRHTLGAARTTLTHSTHSDLLAGEDLHVKVRFCVAPGCTALADDGAPECWFRITHPFYPGDDTSWGYAIGSIGDCEGVVTPVVVERCEIEGCIDGEVTSYCRTDGRHFCE